MRTYGHRWSISALTVASSLVMVGIAGTQPAIASGSSLGQLMERDHTRAS